MKVNRLFTGFKEAMDQHHGVQPASKAIPQIEQWFDNPLGKELLSQQQLAVENALSCLFGYHLMQLSMSRKVQLFNSSTINHRFTLSPACYTENSTIAGQSFFDSLPLPAESIDVAVLHHVLEFSERPHQLLREVSRVIIPRGHLVIVGFNPWSIMGGYKRFARIVTASPQWRYHSLRLGRILDWLRLLDFEITGIEHGFFGPPINSTSLLKRMSWIDRLGRRLHLPNGAYFCVVARKEVTAIVPMRPVWQRLNPIVGLAASKPSTRLPDPARMRELSPVKKASENQVSEH